MSKTVDQAVVGDWYNFCCYSDLYQIESEELLEQLRNDDIPYRVWPTKLEALIELREDVVDSLRFTFGNKESEKAIQEEIAKLDDDIQKEQHYG